MPSDYSPINTSSISNDWMKREQPKRVVEAYERDIRQVIPLLKKLKRGSLDLEESVQDNSNLVLVSNIHIHLGSC